MGKVEEEAESRPIAVPLKHAVEALVWHTLPPAPAGLWNSPAPADFSTRHTLGR